MKKLPGIIIGALLIACGIIYSLAVFGITDINFSLDGWWTLFIILPCLFGLISGKDKFGSFIGLLVGVLLLLAARDVFEYDMVWKIIAPVIVVMIGIKLIVKSVGASGENDNTQPVGEQNELMAVFTSQTQDYSGADFSAAKVGAIFGGAECNLANAQIADGSKIDVMCAFGGVDIFLPDNVTVKNNSFCFFGGMSDKRDKKNQSDKNITVYINGFCLFGGIDLK